MLLSDVVSIRVSKDLKKAMKKVNINWRKEIENFIKMKIREHLRDSYLEKAKQYRKRLPEIEFSNAELIREDRNGR